MEYTFHAPAYVVFGMDSRLQIGELLKKWNAGRNVLLVHGKNVKASGLVDDIDECLRDYKFNVYTFDNVQTDAPVGVIREGVAFAKKHDISTIVAIGGGSGMDIAKAISVMLDNPDDILKYAGVDLLPKRRQNVFVAIPTTCGTGSEITDGGVVLDTDNGRKIPFWDVFAGPDIAILDPFFLQTLPKHLVVQTALDALAHSVEAYTSIMSNPISDALALGAIEIVRKYAPLAYDEKDTEQALEMLLTASNMAGIAFNRSNVHMGHAIAHAAGAVAHIHHGAACALALPFVLQTQAEAIPDRIRKIGQMMGFEMPQDDERLGSAAASAMADFCSKLGVKSLKEYGVAAENLDDIVSLACSDFIMNVAPRPCSPEELKAYLQSH